MVVMGVMVDSTNESPKPHAPPLGPPFTRPPRLRPSQHALAKVVEAKQLLTKRHDQAAAPAAELLAQLRWVEPGMSYSNESAVMDVSVGTGEQAVATTTTAGESTAV